MSINQSHAHETSLAGGFILWRLFTEDHSTKCVSPLLSPRLPAGPGALSTLVRTEPPRPFKLQHRVLRCCLFIIVLLVNV